jgi:hypothetical protein
MGFRSIEVEYFGVKLAGSSDAAKKTSEYEKHTKSTPIYCLGTVRHITIYDLC